RLKAVQDKVRAAEESRWRKTDPEAQARVEQFRERVQQFEEQAAKARGAGDTRRAEQAEQQAAQWREWLATAEQALADRCRSTREGPGFPGPRRPFRPRETTRGAARHRA